MTPNIFQFTILWDHEKIHQFFGWRWIVNTDNHAFMHAVSMTQPNTNICIAWFGIPHFNVDAHLSVKEMLVISLKSAMGFQKSPISDLWCHQIPFKLKCLHFQWFKAGRGQISSPQFQTTKLCKKTHNPHFSLMQHSLGDSRCCLPQNVPFPNSFAWNAIFVGSHNACLSPQCLDIFIWLHHCRTCSSIFFQLIWMLCDSALFWVPCAVHLPMMHCNFQLRKMNFLKLMHWNNWHTEFCW